MVGCRWGSGGAGGGAGRGVGPAAPSTVAASPTSTSLRPWPKPPRRPRHMGRPSSSTCGLTATPTLRNSTSSSSRFMVGHKFIYKKDYNMRKPLFEYYGLSRGGVGRQPPGLSLLFDNTQPLARRGGPSRRGPGNRFAKIPPCPGTRFAIYPARHPPVIRLGYSKLEHSKKFRRCSSNH